MKNVLICVCTLMPLLCVASASNNALRSFSSSSSKQRNLKDKLPSMCTGEQDSCTCKDFLANLKAATFQAANKTAWDKYQALSSYQKVLETELSGPPRWIAGNPSGRCLFGKEIKVFGVYPYYFPNLLRYQKLCMGK